MNPDQVVSPELLPTERQQKYQESLLKLRQMHDDPNSGISDANRAMLNKLLYQENRLGLPKEKITAKNLFPLSNEVADAVGDVYSGKFAPWDAQHPFISTGQKLREVSGALPFISSPIAGAIDTVNLLPKAIIRPAVESIQGTSPQLNFIEKSARSLQSNRDIGDVAARRTATDFPALVNRYVSQGMSQEEAANKAQGELTRNWVLGGIVENAMNIADPFTLIRGARAAGKGINSMMSGARKLEGTPGIIKGMDTAIGSTKLARPEFSNPVSASQVKPPMQFFDPEIGPTPPVDKNNFLDPELSPYGTPFARPKTQRPLPVVKIAPVSPQSFKPGQFSNPNDSNLLNFLAQNFEPRVIVRMSPEQRLQFGNMTPNELRDAVGVMKPPISVVPQDLIGPPTNNILEQSASAQPVQQRVQSPKRPSSAFTPVAQGQMVMKDQGKDIRSFTKTQRPLPTYDNPIVPVMDPEQPKFDFTKGPQEPILPSDKLIHVTPSVVKPMSNEMQSLRAEKKALLDQADDWTPTQEARMRVINKQISELTMKSKKAPTVLSDIEDLTEPTPMSDLKTILKGVRFKKKDPNITEMNMGIKPNDLELDDAAKAAITRWKEMHGPAVLASIKASGKSTYEHLKDQFPDISDARLRAMADILSPSTSTVAKSMISSSNKEVPVTTKINDKGEDLGQYKGNVNLTKYSDPEIAGKVMDIIDNNPEIASTMHLKDGDIEKMAESINMGEKLAYLWKRIQASPTGQLASEVRAENKVLANKVQALLSTDFGQDVSKLQDALKTSIAKDIGKNTKGMSEIGRTLREGQLSVEAQTTIANQLQDLLKKYKGNKNVTKSIEEFKKAVLDPEFRPTYFDKAYYIWINSLLSSPKTHFQNSLSNTINLFSKFPDRAIESLIDMPLSLVTGKRSTTMDEIPRMARALKKNEPLPPEYAYNAENKLTENSQNISPLTGPISKHFEPAMYGTKALVKADKYFGNKISQMEKAALEGKDLSELDKVNLVKDEAKERTLTRDPSSVTKVILFAKRNIPGVRWMTAFVRTSADIIGQAIEHTPVGVYGIAKSASKGTLTQRELAKRLRKLSVGTAFGVYAYKEFKKGNIVGDFSTTSDKERKHSSDLLHGKENAIKINNRWFPLSSIEPYGSILSTFVNFFEGQDKEYKTDQDAADAFMAGVNKAGAALLNKRYLTGLNDAAKISKNPASGGLDALGNIAAGFVPSVVKDVADIVDTTRRKADSGFDKIKSRIPFVSKTLPPVIDTFGRTTSKPSAFDPFRTTSSKLTPEEMLVKDTAVSLPPNRVSDIKLEGKDKLLMDKRAGDLKRKLINEHSNQIKEASPKKRALLIEKYSNIANTIATAELMSRNKKYLPKRPF